MIYCYLRRCGETGRRAGLKILWSKIRVGSSPTTGTNEQKQPRKGLFFICAHCRRHRAEQCVQMKKRLCIARLLLRVPNGGARPACSTGAVSFLHCLCRRRRRVSTNEKEAVHSTAAFASAERGRTPCVLHRRDPRPIPRRIKRRTVCANEKETVRSTAAFASAERGRTLRVLHRHCAVRARAKIKRPDGAISRALKETRECCRSDIENQEQTTCLRWQSRTGDRSCAYAVKLREVSLC